MTDYMPSDAEEDEIPPPTSSSDTDVVIPPGEAYDVILRRLIPRELNLRNLYLTPWFAPEGQSLPLGDVLNRASGS